MKNIKDTIFENLKNTPASHRLNRKDIVKISNELFNSGEHSGFRKGVDTDEIYIDSLISSYKYSNDSDFKDFKNQVEQEAKTRNLDQIILIDGDGYDGRWAMVAFFSTKPYEYIIYHSYCGCSELLSSKTVDDAIDDILDFVE